MIDDEYKGYNDGQIEALQSVGNVLVSASAGSGKTKVMVDKILKILREDENADITRMVVMTFTRAAAAEIKSRLLKKLYEALRKFNQAKEFDKAEHIRKQIEAFPFTNICTIDSFCFNLVKKYFGVIGADPSCTPYGDDEPARILAECINKVCDEKLNPNNPDPDFIAFAERYAYKRKLDSVKELILKLREFWMGQPDGEEFFKRDGEKAVEAYFMNYAKNHPNPDHKATIPPAGPGWAICTKCGKPLGIILNGRFISTNPAVNGKPVSRMLLAGEGVKKDMLDAERGDCPRWD